MAEDKAANTAVPAEGDHDRVAMLSINKDGSADQHNPELIGNKEFAQAATRRQFAEQAVSAADSARLAEESAAAGAAEQVEQDPTIAERQKEHEKLTKAAEKRADKVVSDLHRG